MNNPVIIGIITSLIASFIFAIAAPRLKQSSRKIVEFIGKLNKNYKNRLYKEAARKDRMLVPNFSLDAIMSLIVLLAAVISVTIIIRFNKITIEAVKTSHELDRTAKQLIVPESNTLEEQIDMVEKSKAEILEVIEKAKVNEMVSMICAVLVVIWLTVKMIENGRIQVIHKLTTDFEHRINLLPLSVNEEKRRLLNRKWAMMQTEEDHQQLMDELLKIEQKQKAL